MIHTPFPVVIQTDLTSLLSRLQVSLVASILLYPSSIIKCQKQKKTNNNNNKINNNDKQVKRIVPSTTTTNRKKELCPLNYNKHLKLVRRGGGGRKKFLVFKLAPWPPHLYTTSFKEQNLPISFQTSYVTK